MNFARQGFEVDLVVGQHAGETLGDPPHGHRWNLPSGDHFSVDGYGISCLSGCR